jgi:hypothetical protein
MRISHFHLFFLKPQNRFETNMADMFIGWSYTICLLLVLIGNSTWLLFSIGSYVKTKSSHGGHLEFPISQRFTSLVQIHPMIIPGQFGFNCPSGFREEAFWNIYPTHIFHIHVSHNIFHIIYLFHILKAMNFAQIFHIFHTISTYRYIPH